jgi:hypothetical protein
MIVRRRTAKPDEGEDLVILPRPWNQS